MIKGSMLKKCISLVMVVALLAGLASPASAAELFSNEEIGYLALGDATTDGVGLNDPDTEAYYNIVGEYLNTDTINHANRRYRIEEIRYLLDNSYSGDGYTKSFNLLGSQRSTVQGYVKSAKVITLSVGVNNFSTYIVNQLTHYLETGGEVKYAYDFSRFAEADVIDTMEKVQAVVMDRLQAAAPDQGDDALELVNFVVEVATYATLSYMESFNATIEKIYELNPDVDLYVIGIYNAANGDVLTYSNGSKEVTIPVGEAFGGLVELANVYAQILAPRAYHYTYVHPGDPQLLIDVMGDKSLSIQDRVPVKLKSELLYAAEDTAVSMIQEMFAQYGIDKSYDEALAIAEEIFYAPSDEYRIDYIKNQIYDLVVEEVLAKFETELENYAGTYGDIDVSADDIRDLLTNLDNAEDIAAREGVATEFVEDLMTKAMIGQTFAGIKIETQQDAYDAIALLERNSQGDASAMREAAADMIYEKVGENGLKDFISRDDVLDLLEQMDKTTSDAEREEAIDAWMNDLAVKKITQKIQGVNPDYKDTDAKNLLAAMQAETNEDAREAIAKNHLLTTGGFHAYMVTKFAETYEANGLALQTYGSFEAFVTAVEQAANNDAAKAIVRTEIRAAAAQKVVSDPTCQNLMGDLTQDEAIALFASLDGAADKDAYMLNWLCDRFNCPNPNAMQLEFIINPMKAVFLNAYNSYNNAATAAEDAFAEYRDGVDTAAEGFSQYVSLKGTAAEQILKAYNESYKGAGETAQKYYADYLKLRKAAVDKVMSGYVDYQNAIQKGMDSCDQLNDKFDKVFSLLCEIAEVEAISLNDLVAVAKKLNNGNYVAEMVENLVQGDKLAKEDKTVAYLALRYYLANAMMIMPSAKGHQTIANQVIKALKGENTDSKLGYLANRVIDEGIDIYHCAEKYLKLPTTGSGQVGTLINPDVYVAFGDDITAGSALTGDAQAYPEILAGALAMADDTFDDDVLCNLTLEGMRTEELLALLDPSYNGDAYTEARYGDKIDQMREAYLEYIKTADLITINVGVNNVTTYPLMQTLLAYNGEETYEMDWDRYIGQSRYNKINKGKAAVTDLLLGIVDTAESREPALDGISAYEKAERTLNTVSTALEAWLYGMIGYAVNLDAAVEKVAELNSEATIVLLGAYNPLEGTYFQVDRTVEIKDHELDLSKININTSALADKAINLTNRFLTNFVGFYGTDGTAAHEGSRIVTVDIKNTELIIDDADGVSKDLSTLANWKTVSVKGHDITIKIPSYFLETGRTAGEALHPNADGHQYIADQILDALKFDIYADVVLGEYEKFYGDADPDFTYLIDDLSTLYQLDDENITIWRDAGEDVGEYTVYASVDFVGYKEVDVELGKLIIVKREATIKVTVENGAIKEVSDWGNVLEGDKDEINDTLTLHTDGSVTCDSAAIQNNYDLTIEVIDETLVPVGTVDLTTATLNLEGEIHYNVLFTLDGFDMSTIEEIYLLTFYSRTDELTDSEYDDTEYKSTGYFYHEDYGCYVLRSEGIPAKNLGDDVWYRVCVKTVDGQLVHSRRIKFSAEIYSTSVLRPNSAYTDELKALCVALMNYGTAAQHYFDYKTNDLMNTFVTAEDQSRVVDYSADMLDERVNYVPSKHGEFGTTDRSVFNSGYDSNLTLLGAIKQNIYVRYNAPTATEAGFIVWTEDTYLSADVLTRENGIVIPCDPNGSITLEYAGIAAKDMNKTVFWTAYVRVDGQYSYTGMSRMSVDNYASKIINDTTGRYGDAMVQLAKYMVVYGEYANEYFY